VPVILSGSRYRPDRDQSLPEVQETSGFSRRFQVGSDLKML